MSLRQNAFRALRRYYVRQQSINSLVSRIVAGTFRWSWESYKLARLFWSAFVGRNDGSWGDAPAQRLGYLGLRIATNKFTAGYRRIGMMSSAMLKYREMQHIDKMNFVARLDQPIDQTILRNLVAWHQNVILENPEIPPHALFNLVLRLTRARNDARIGDLLSLGYLSDRVNNISLYWDDAVADADMPFTMSKREIQKRASGQSDFDLAQGGSPELLRLLELAGCPGAFKLLLGSRKKLNDFLKAAAPGCISIAVSLHEAADGAVAQVELERWTAVFQRVHAEFPYVLFCVVNRADLAGESDVPPYVRFVQDLGFSFLEAIGTAQYADHFVGVLDAFGLAALANKRTGVYLSFDPQIYVAHELAFAVSEDEDPTELAPDVWRFPSSPTTDDIVDSLMGVLRRDALAAKSPEVLASPHDSGGPELKSSGRGR